MQLRKILLKAVELVICLALIITGALSYSQIAEAASSTSVVYTWPGYTDKLKVSSDGWGNNVPGHKKANGSHFGQDFTFTASSVVITAAAPGTVKDIGYESEGYGHYVIIEHANKQVTLYAHLTGTSVKEKATVARGQKVGYVNSGGSTGFVYGNCMHFGIYNSYSDKLKEYHAGVEASDVSVDPMKYLQKINGKDFCKTHTCKKSASIKKGVCDKCGLSYTEWDTKQEKWSTGSDVVSSKKQYYRTSAKANFRKYPSTKGNIIKKVDKDTGFCVIAKKGNWYKVKNVKGTIGYMSKTVLKKYTSISKNDSTLSVKLNSSVTKPMTKGTSRYITGSVSSKYPLVYVSVVIMDSNGKTNKIYTKTFDDYIYRNMTVNDTWKFVKKLNLKDIGGGTWTVRIAAKDISGRGKIADGTLVIYHSGTEAPTLTASEREDGGYDVTAKNNENGGTLYIYSNGSKLKSTSDKSAQISLTSPGTYLIESYAWSDGKRTANSSLKVKVESSSKEEANEPEDIQAEDIQDNIEYDGPDIIGDDVDEETEETGVSEEEENSNVEPEEEQTVQPKKTSLKTLKKGKKSMTVRWNKQSSKISGKRITGYQIEYSRSSDFDNSKKVKVKGYKKTSRKIKSLKSKKKYYVRIRTYVTLDGSNYYSDWSKVKSVKVN